MVFAIWIKFKDKLGKDKLGGELMAKSKKTRKAPRVVPVKKHTRKNGEVVPAHKRSKPDGIKSNNHSN